MKYKSLFLAGISAALISEAPAAPPEGANPDLAPYFQNLHTKDSSPGWCCSAADCRPVRARYSQVGWEVFIDKRTFGPDSGAPDEWVLVPREAMVVPNPAPTRPQTATACWYGGVVRCFDQPLTEG